MAILHNKKKTFKINIDTIINQFNADSTQSGRILQIT